MSNTVVRWIEMLRLIPRDPHRIDASTLQARLRDRGYDVSLRSLQRDLIEASRHFPLLSDETSKPFGWYFPRNYLLDLPSMSAPMALAFSMLQSHAAHLLPELITKQLTPWFQQAEQVLSADPGGLRSWKDHVRVIPDWMPLLPPKIDEEVFSAVQTALLKGQRLEGWYQGRADKEPKYFLVNPLGLVARQQIFYLVATVGEYTDPLHLVLHRFSQARLLEQPAKPIPDFDLDRHIEQGAFGIISGDPVRIRLRFQRIAGMHLLETPISEDQEVIDDGEDHFILTATVPNTEMLDWWIASFEGRVERLKGL